MTPLRSLVVALALALALPSLFGAAAPPPNGTQHVEEWFPMGDGLTTLHADILRDADVPMDVAQPVLLTVSPYTGHAGATIDHGGTGPSDRFQDFLDLSDLYERGWTYVMVDLPGFGGSSGCNDWGGPREQMAVKAAVEWVAAQPWSTGRVGMLGKSYDAWTGLMGMAQDPDGLEAVVAMEPVFSGYRYAYMNGVRFANSVGTVALFQAMDAKPGPTQEPGYTVAGAPQAYCYGDNMAQWQVDEESFAYWQERNLIERAAGSDVPLFLTQGFLETNTKPDGAFDYWAGMTNPANRAWFGQFDHIRGWEGAPERPLAGQATFVDQVMRFLDEHVREVAPSTPVLPAVEVQDNLGRYRGEQTWPPTDSAALPTDLRLGTYLDDGGNTATGALAGQGIWSISQALPHDVWLAGEPDLQLTVDAMPRANLAANVYDIAPNGRATLVSRGATLLRGLGVQEVGFRLYGQDWVLPAGHRIGVLVSSSNADWFVHVPTRTDVELLGGRMFLPFLTEPRTSFIKGGRSTPRLQEHWASAGFQVSDATIEEGEVTFSLPRNLGPLR